MPQLDSESQLLCLALHPGVHSPLWRLLCTHKIIGTTVWMPIYLSYIEHQDCEGCHVRAGRGTTCGAQQLRFICTVVVVQQLQWPRIRHILGVQLI